MNTKTLEAEKLSIQFRQSTAGFLTQRRAIAALSLIAIGSMGVISLYQLGIIKHLPDPPLPMLDSDKVDASAESYSRLSTPDAVLALGNYAATLGLAAMSGPDRAQQQPWIPLALALKIAFDASQAVRLFVDQLTKFRSFCFWCLLAAAASLATVPLAIPETVAAVKRLLGKA